MFKEMFKYYKKKQPEPDYTSILNLRSGDGSKWIKHKIKIESFEWNLFDKLGLIDPTEWKIYELKMHPGTTGLIVIVNPFTSNGQRYWITRSLADYSTKPSVTNVDNQMDVQNVISKYGTWWDAVCSESSDSECSIKHRLRWATMGYHHNWDTKMYSESFKCSVPDDLNALSKCIVRYVLDMDFESEAVIVNYYQMDSSLSGHVDQSELNMDAPLVSFSFGQSAIFLLGKSSLEETPTAILVESGDIVLMLGECRLSYHGVPKIIRSPLSPWNDFNSKETYSQNDECDEKFWNPFSKFINDTRININIRQVLFPNQSSL